MGQCASNWQRYIREKNAKIKRDEIEAALVSINEKIRQRSKDKMDYERDFLRFQEQIEKASKNPDKKPERLIEADLKVLVVQKKLQERQIAQAVADINLAQSQQAMFLMQKNKLHLADHDEQIMSSAKSLHMNLSRQEKKSEEQQQVLEELEEAIQTVTDELEGVADQHLTVLGVQEEVDELLKKHKKEGCTSDTYKPVTQPTRKPVTQQMSASSTTVVHKQKTTVSSTTRNNKHDSMMA